MKELYLFAFINFVACHVVIFISICRLNSMNKDVMVRVRSEYTAYIAGAMASAWQPTWGEWPQWGSLGITAALMIGLFCSSRAWHKDVPPASASAPAPLGEH